MVRFHRVDFEREELTARVTVASASPRVSIVIILSALSHRATPRPEGLDQSRRRRKIRMSSADARKMVVKPSREFFDFFLKPAFRAYF
jgi:hypothetical protein